jgi:hypothetical protein
VRQVLLLGTKRRESREKIYSDCQGGGEVCGLLGL